MRQAPVRSISVIIPTKNRAADLAKTVGSLLTQTRLPDELVLIDQSPERSFTNPINIPVRYIHDPSLSGLSTARNAGMEIASGDIWLFLDDDVALEPHFVQELLDAYKPGVIGVSGIIINYRKPPLLRRVWEVVFVRGPFDDQRQRVYRRAEKLRNGPPVPVRQFTGALMSFRAADVRHLRFDENLTGPSPGEDIDFCARLPKDSVLMIAPQARLVHKRSPAGRNQAHWLLVHAQVNAYMRQRHWGSGVWNRLCFGWLNVGYALAASLSALERRSLEPWRAWREGLRKGDEIAGGKTSNQHPGPKRR